MPADPSPPPSFMPFLFLYSFFERREGGARAAAENGEPNTKNEPESASPHDAAISTTNGKAVDAAVGATYSAARVSTDQLSHKYLPRFRSGIGPQ